MYTCFKKVLIPLCTTVSIENTFVYSMTTIKIVKVDLFSNYGNYYQYQIIYKCSIRQLRNLYVMQF